MSASESIILERVLIQLCAFFLSKAGVLVFAPFSGILPRLVVLCVSKKIHQGYRTYNFVCILKNLNITKEISFNTTLTMD